MSTRKWPVTLSLAYCPHCEIAMATVTVEEEPLTFKVIGVFKHPNEGDLKMGPRTIPCGYRNKNVMAVWNQIPRIELLSMDPVD